MPPLSEDQQTIAVVSFASNLEEVPPLDPSSLMTTSAAEPTITTVLTSLMPATRYTPHLMVTHLKCGIKKQPREKLNLHVDSTSPIVHTYLQAFIDPNWLKSMKEEYYALIKQ